MTITLQSALAPLFIISWFLCLGLFEYPLGQPRWYFSCLYILSVWSGLIYYCYYPFITVVVKGSGLIVTLILLLNNLSSILISLYRYKELKICLCELSIVNDTLEALGAPKEYQMLRNWIIRIIFVWITYFFTEFAMLCYILCNIYSYRFVDLFKGIYSLLYLSDYAKHVNISSALICGTLLGYTSSRFHRVNDRLHILYSNLFENNADYGCKRQTSSILVCYQITGAKDRKQDIWILM
ncbi:hypothetical protein ALC62_11107 [Cyphomyrmex costatus]|uniref:Gustatory receptor n=1 Tax=Cyphomyrmex costatus TaxID=456900 RepID=A0A151ICU4_9HYME|nr:hypothetical protein ALC62_11107 [Cyphomyrmex costatus]